ncbi:MAG: DNA-directed RNA polymerase subunit beta, partial [Candidatus Saccharimonadales bacterium]
MAVGSQTRRKTYARTPTILNLPRLTEIQLRSFEWFKEEGLRELFEEISPIVSFNKNLELHFGDFYFGEPKYPEAECRERDITYSAPLWVKIKLVNKDTGEISEQEVFMGDFPLMTEAATFIINGSERVVVSQLIRSPGVYFSVEEDRSTGRELGSGKLIPNRGAWLEFESSKRDVISVKVDRKRKLPVTILLRAVGFGTDDEIRELFQDVDTNYDHPYIESTLERDPTSNPTDNSEKGVEDALLEFYKNLRPGDPPTLDNAKSFVQNLFFTPRRYDMGRVGRYKLNRALSLDSDQETRVLTTEDLVAVIRYIVNINNGLAGKTDIDHLGN